MNEKTSPQVSILIPVYGVEAFIERCVRSLYEQTFDNIEYIFVNDCTPDNSINILKKLLKEYPLRSKQTRIINHKKNSGIAQVRNTLLENASGNYLIFFDSDDWAEKNMIEKLYTKATEDYADIVGCDFYFSYGDKNIYQYEIYSSDYLTNLRNIISLRLGGYLHKLLIRREIYTFNNIKFTPGINVGEDYIVSVKLYYFTTKTSYLHEALYYYVQYNPANYSRISLQNINDRIKAVSEVEKFCRETNIIRHVQKEIDGRKLIIKNPFLFYDEYIDYRKWADTFPEANYAWRHLSIRPDYKIIYWLAEHHAFGLISLIKFIKNRIKK